MERTTDGQSNSVSYTSYEESGDGCGYTGLAYVFSVEGRVAPLRFALDHGADVNGPPIDAGRFKGRGPLHEAAYCGEEEVRQQQPKFAKNLQGHNLRAIMN